MEYQLISLSEVNIPCVNVSNLCTGAATPVILIQFLVGIDVIPNEVERVGTALVLYAGPYNVIFLDLEPLGQSCTERLIPHHWTSAIGT